MRPAFFKCFSPLDFCFLTALAKSESIPSKSDGHSRMSSNSARSPSRRCRLLSANRSGQHQAYGNRREGSHRSRILVSGTVPRFDATIAVAPPPVLRRNLPMFRCTFMVQAPRFDGRSLRYGRAVTSSNPLPLAASRSKRGHGEIGFATIYKLSKPISPPNW